jgi:hypothetical protein
LDLTYDADNEPVFEVMQADESKAGLQWQSSVMLLGLWGCDVCSFMCAWVCACVFVCVCACAFGCRDLVVVFVLVWCVRVCVVGAGCAGLLRLP